MTCVKIVQYAQESKEQIYDFHRHIVNALSLNTNSYFQQLNMRLAFAPLLARTRAWGEQVSILNNALVSNNDFACVALVNNQGKELAKAFDSKLAHFVPPINLSRNALFLKVSPDRHADTGAVYEQDGQSLFDNLYPLENGDWMYVAIRWDPLKKILFDQQVGTKGYIWLIDETGLIAGDSQNARAGERLPNWDFLKERQEDRAAWMGEFKDPNGMSSVGAGKWIQSAGWFVLSAQPQSEAYAKTSRLKWEAYFCVVLS